jgi:hypothetical protein
MHREVTLLTENEVQRSFRNMFKSKDVPPDTFDKAEALLEEARVLFATNLSVELEDMPSCTRRKPDPARKIGLLLQLLAFRKRTGRGADAAFLPHR